MAGPRKRRVQWQGQEVDATIVLVENQVENFSTYNLEDGTQLRIKTVVTDVLRLDGHYNAEGDPVYMVKSQNIVTTNCPDSLRRPAGG